MYVGDRGDEVTDDSIGRKTVEHVVLLVSKQRRKQPQVGKVQVVAAGVEHHDGTVAVDTRLQLERRLRPAARYGGDLKIVGDDQPAIEVTAILETAHHGKLLTGTNAHLVQ